MCEKKQTVLGAVIVVVIALFVPVPSIAGDLDPSAAPAPTMKTLDEIPGSWSRTLSCESTSNCPRFQIVLGGEAVLDKETGLVWEKSPSTTVAPWAIAMFTCQTKIVGNRKGWRLPTVEELASLVDSSTIDPSLPSGHPFTNVQSFYYWSVTTTVYYTNAAWSVFFGTGGVYDSLSKIEGNNVWCVRGGQGYDGQ